jgi:SAM-dependent methyltransferase
MLPRTTRSQQAQERNWSTSSRVLHFFFGVLFGALATRTTSLINCRQIDGTMQAVAHDTVANIRSPFSEANTKVRAKATAKTSAVTIATTVDNHSSTSAPTVQRPEEKTERLGKTRSAGMCAATSPMEDPLQTVHEVNLNARGHICRIKKTDAELLEECRKKMASTASPPSTPWPALDEIPILKLKDLPAKEMDLQKKYERRVKNEGGCLKPKGMWGNLFNSRCTILTMAKAGPYLPGQLVLDWGAGCGHQATYMTKTFGVRVVGLDLNSAAIEWAKEHSFGRFVGPTDGTDLSWAPDESFDHFYSFATVYYVKPNAMCNFGREVIRILKPGGTALFGWMDGIYSRPYGRFPESNFDCLRALPNADVTTPKENAGGLYSDNGGDLITNSGTYAVVIRKKI